MTPADRRKYARIPLAVPISMRDFRQGSWSGTTVDLSPYGLKAAAKDVDVALRPGDSVRVSFTPPEGGGPVDVLCSLVRADASSVALAFVNLQMPDFQRLCKLVDARLRSQP